VKPWGTMFKMIGKEVRKFIAAIGTIICACLAICNDDDKPPDDVKPVVVSLRSDSSSRENVAMDDAMDVVGNYVKRSGDTMFGTLRMNGVGNRGSILWNGNVPCGSNGSVCLYYTQSTGIFSAYVAGADRFTLNNASGAITSVGGWTQTGQFDVTGAITSNNVIQSSRNADVSFNTAGTGWFQSAGDTSANIATRVPTAGSGALIYDDTNNCWRAFQNGAWAGCIATVASTGDGGASPSNATIFSVGSSPFHNCPDGGGCNPSGDSLNRFNIAGFGQSMTLRTLTGFISAPSSPADGYITEHCFNVLPTGASVTKSCFADISCDGTGIGFDGGGIFTIPFKPYNSASDCSFGPNEIVSCFTLNAMIDGGQTCTAAYTVKVGNFSVGATYP
jgi:hypothetical protein